MALKRLLNSICSALGSKHEAKAQNGASTEQEESLSVDPKLSIMNDGWGHARSKELRRPVGANEEPLPWFTYPAIEFLQQLELSDARVLEWGAGGSTLFWGSRCARVCTIERSREWFDDIADKAPTNVSLQFAPDEKGYLSPDFADKEFEIIVIDGELRKKCAEQAMGLLAKGGMIILDNSDWYTKAAEFLRESGLAQVDLSGFGPVNDYTWSTSVYIEGVMNFKPRLDWLPAHGIGSIEVLAEEERSG